MTTSRRRKTERYEFKNSPWVQNLTQREFAQLLGTTKSKLEALIEHKESWTVRRKALIGKKERDLAYPSGQLRTVHDRIKYHLNKIKQPDYLFSPRKGRGQRDNAAVHAGQTQFLKLDIRQFYPSTSDEHIFRWAHHVAGLRSDVAGLFTHLVTIDDRMSFGSPLSPILATLVHRAMFDAIYVACSARGLRMSLWVDDLTISGKFTPGDLVGEIREIVRQNGLQTHKIVFRAHSPVVEITGVPIINGRVGAPRALHQRIQDTYSALREAVTDAERWKETDRLLGHLGSYRYHVGARTEAGRKAAGQMNGLRQRRAGLSPILITVATVGPLSNTEVFVPDLGADEEPQPF